MKKKSQTCQKKFLKSHKLVKKYHKEWQISEKNVTKSEKLVKKSHKHVNKNVK